MNPNMIILKKWRWTFLSKRKLLKENFKFGLNSTYALIMLFVGALWIYYVWTLNENATKGFQIRNLEIERRSLVLESELLEVQVAEMESLNYLLNSKVAERIKKVESPEYIVLEWEKTFVYNN